MEKLGDVVADRRRRLFVGRQTELAHVRRWLADPSAPSTVMAISGLGGIGKSVLLLEMLRVSGEHGATALWLDGRTCTRSPAGFLEYLRSLVPRGAGDAPAELDPREALASLVAAGHRVVLGVDNYDDIDLLEGWLREDFAGGLPARSVLLILASRPGLSGLWLTDPAWRGRLVALTLSPLTRSEAREHLTRLGMGDSPASEQLLREAGGHPLALCLGAEVLQQRQAGATAADLGLTQQISVHLLREVARPDLHPLLEALAILPAADQELLAAVLGQAPTPDQYHALTQLSLVRLSDRGLALHDVARAHLLDDLRRRAPERFRTMRRRGLQALRTRLSATTGRYPRQRLAADLLALCQHALPIQEWFADLTATVDLLSPGPVRPEEVPALRAMMIRWAAFSHAAQDDRLDDESAMLAGLCARYPDSIRVVRSPAGEPLAFGAAVLLHRGSAAILERSRAAAIYLRQCPPAERQALDCSPAEADTYYVPKSAAVVDHPEYSVSELYGVLIRDYLALMGDGVRLMIVLANPEIAAFLARLGFVPRPDCHDTWAGVPWPFGVWELDQRQRDFGDWVSAFLDAVESEPLPGSAAAPQPLERETLRDLRPALMSIDYPSRLEGSALARRLGCSGRELRSRIRELMTRDDPLPPLTPADQQVLRAAFLHRGATPDAAATRLHFSRATYYRRLRAAMAALAEALMNHPGPDRDGTS